MTNYENSPHPTHPRRSTSESECFVHALRDPESGESRGLWYPRSGLDLRFHHHGSSRRTSLNNVGRSDDDHLGPSGVVNNLASPPECPASGVEHSNA